MKNLTDFRKTVENGVDPRLDIHEHLNRQNRRGHAYSSPRRSTKMATYLF